MDYFDVLQSSMVDIKALFGCSISVESWQLILANLKYGDEMGPLFG